MKISETGINIIRDAEQLRLIAYLCPAGKWTIGYGHTLGVKQEDWITPEQAEQMLRTDLLWVEDTLNTLGNFTQNQFDALASFVYNFGTPKFLNSTLLKKIQANAEKSEIIEEWRKWIFAGGKIQYGLIKRRQKEIDLFFAEN